MTTLKPKHRLSQKQIRFAREYAVHGNGTQAARDAGYSKSTNHVLEQQAYENLRKPVVLAEVEKQVAKYEADYSPQRVRRRLHEISHASEGAGQFGPAVRCEELLGKAAGMWVDQSLQLTGVLNDSHVAALLQLARKRQLEPIDLEDDSKQDKDAEK